MTLGDKEEAEPFGTTGDPIKAVDPLNAAEPARAAEPAKAAGDPWLP